MLDRPVAAVQRVTLAAERGLTDTDQIIGCAVLTVLPIAPSDVARPPRALNGTQCAPRSDPGALRHLGSPSGLAHPGRRASRCS